MGVRVPYAALKLRDSLYMTTCTSYFFVCWCDCHWYYFRLNCLRLCLCGIVCECLICYFRCDNIVRCFYLAGWDRGVIIVKLPWCIIVFSEVFRVIKSYCVL